ncbi:ABC transporter ATP-binding protein [Nostocoides sp. Soil756]|uniref:ABC transporter ATP-binding protein n=1 Tax=Nostocoides sp. Soil756 TaxID=1736399 RepID=UPI0006F49B2C|nr:ABC transporter ATP-binding protein [Tetrasphaera sp. Soil756]KRE60633.1 ABC transporter ATP-binding protein [Tetrasphaera sp. Soil756]
MTLDAQVRLTRGTLELDLPLRAADGEVLAVLGPNGAGKTTALHALAGLVRLGAGHVRVDGETWAGDGVHLDPSLRRVGMLSADHLLFPHLTARGNVAFGPRSRGASRAAAAARADAELEALGVLDLARRRPAQLSHGQAQRVALGRALATDPRLLLLDEPLSALDPGLRPQVRATLAARLREFRGSAVLVTHDPLDALTLADHLVFVETGRIVQEGSPTDVVARPRNPYVAQVVGLNLYPGTADDGTTVSTPLGAVVTGGHDHRGPSWVAFAPSAVALYPDAPHGSTRNAWAARVASVELVGQSARVRLVTGGAGPAVLAEVTAGSVATLRLQPGQELWAGVKATEVSAYPR